jgi:hypothetical protein
VVATTAAAVDPDALRAVLTNFWTVRGVMACWPS